MLKNYIKIALRNLQKQKLYSAINVIGISVGLAFCLLVILFVHDELSYDSFHENADQIYQVYRQPLIESEIFDVSNSLPFPLAQAMEEGFPEVEETIRMAAFGTNTIRHRNALFEQDNFAFADPSIFDVFSFPFEYGDPNSALSSPGSVVLTQQTAAKYFSTNNPIGETLEINIDGEFHQFEVTGVMEDIPTNSSIQFEILLPTQAIINNFEFYSRALTSWGSSRSAVFVKMNEGSDIEALNERMPEFMTTHMGDMFNRMREAGLVEGPGTPIVFSFQPLLDIHLNPGIPGEFVRPNDPENAYILGGIALAVLFIACFNFMILSIAKSSKRAKEVGLRKVMGAQRSQLIAQFWGEAFIITLLGFLTGIAFAEILLPVFNELTGKSLSFITNAQNLTLFGVITFLFSCTVLIAGSYPSLVLSKFQPIDSIKDKFSISGSNRFTRLLIVTQYSLSAFLLIATLVMAEQLQFIQNKNLGFSGEQVVVIPTNGLDGDRMLSLYKDQLHNDNDIVDMTGASFSFATGLRRRGYRFEGEARQAAVFRTDHNYIRTLQMNLVSGRNFDPNLSSDSTASIIVNEAFMLAHSLSDNALGEPFALGWNWMPNPVIIGVVEDFNYQSLRNDIEPAIMYTNPRDQIANILIRIKPDDISATLAKLRNNWEQVTNEVPFSYSFLDEDMQIRYAADQRWRTIISYGSLFAILIASLGLFGLAGVTAIQRRKEIGIRKVLGASVEGIVLLLSKDISKLILISIFIAAPVAWYVLNNWLENFAYRTEIGADVFLISGSLSLLVALLTISYQSIKAALTNPVKTLRSE